METHVFAQPHKIDGICVHCSDYHSITVEKPDLDALYGKDRPLIQNLFPYLTASERELFFQSGLCGKCWDELF
jgi:hypothetical protein